MRAYIFQLFAIYLALLTPSKALEPITPPGGQIGTSVEITLQDQNIASFQELITYQPGLTLTDLTPDPKNKKRAKATLVISPDAPLGEHSLRIRTAHDISFLRTFYVGILPTVPETEPNDSPPQFQKIPLNSTVHGIIKTEDQDNFLVSLKKGQRISIEVEAMRLGHTKFDALLELHSPNGKKIAESDDTSLLKTEPYISRIAPADGDYRILLRETSYEGNDQSHYRLHIGTFPRPSSVSPLSGNPGETIEFTFSGDPSGPFKQTFTLPNEPTENFPIFPVSNGQSAPSPHFIRVSPYPHIAQPENNGNRSNPTQLHSIPCTADGVISGNHTSRWFKFYAKKNQNLEFRIFARSLRSPLDSKISIRSSENKFLAGNDDDQNFPDSLVKWNAPEDGEYTIKVEDQLGRTGPDFTFLLEVTEKQPAILATLPTLLRDKSQVGKTFTIPRGNRYAAVIQLKRENIGCAINFSTRNLPPGIRLIAPPVPKSLNSFPIILEASVDAPLSSSLQTYTIQATGDNAPTDLSSPLTDTVHHIEIPNEGIYHSHTSTRIPTAVTEPAPFSISVETPKTPIVKNGKTTLRIRASRADGFKEKITTKFLWNPPGISAPVSVEIPADKSEASYELNANGDAVPATWQVCVTAEANTPHGIQTISSSFIPLSVEDPFVKLSLNFADIEVGKTSTITASIEQLRDFQGNATAKLLSLPHGITAQPVDFSKDQQEISFKITASKDARPSKTGGLLCEVEIPQNGQKILHLTGHGGSLRIDAPEKNKDR